MSNESVVKVLSRAREYIERGWTQGVAARDERGEAVNPGAQEACSWCVLGAASLAMRDFGYGGNGAFAALEVSLPAPFSYTSVFNDARGRTKEEVLELFDRAIARVKEDAHEQ